MDIISMIKSITELILVLIKKFESTPSEERHKLMADFDQAMQKAKIQGDLSELSKWLGKRL